MSARRIAALIPAVVLASAGCAAPTTSPSAVPTPTTAVAEPAPGDGSREQQAAEAELCDPQSEEGMSRLADELDRLDGADPEGLSGRLTGAHANLVALSLGPDATSVRDAAVGALRDLEADLDAGVADSPSAAIAAQMLRELEFQLCPPAES